MCNHEHTHDKYYEVRDESGHLEENGYTVYCDDCGELVEVQND